MAKKQEINTVAVKVTLTIEVEAKEWIDYHRVEPTMDQTPRQALIADVKDFFEDGEYLTEQLGSNFSSVARIV